MPTHSLPAPRPRPSPRTRPGQRAAWSRAFPRRTWNVWGPSARARCPTPARRCSGLVWVGSARCLLARFCPSGNFCLAIHPGPGRPPTRPPDPQAPSSGGPGFTVQLHPGLPTSEFPLAPHNYIFFPQPGNPSFAVGSPKKPHRC